MANRRFVFVMSKASDTVGIVNGSDVEIRAESIDSAIEAVKVFAESWKVDSFRLIGERLGFKSSARLIAAVPVSEIPEHIQQNERVELAKEVA